MSDTPKDPQELREERVIALILGELDAHETEQVRGWLETDNALATFHRRMKGTMDLVSEAAAAGKAKAAEALPDVTRLSEARRNALLQHFNTPPATAEPKAERPRRAWPRLNHWPYRWAIPMAMAASLIFFMGLMLFEMRRTRDQMAMSSPVSTRFDRTTESGWRRLNPAKAKAKAQRFRNLSEQDVSNGLLGRGVTPQDSNGRGLFLGDENFYIASEQKALTSASDRALTESRAATSLEAQESAPSTFGEESDSFGRETGQNFYLGLEVVRKPEGGSSVDVAEGIFLPKKGAVEASAELTPSPVEGRAWGGQQTEYLRRTESVVTTDPAAPAEGFPVGGAAGSASVTATAPAALPPSQPPVAAGPKQASTPRSGLREPLRFDVRRSGDQDGLPDVVATFDDTLASQVRDQSGQESTIQLRDLETPQPSARSIRPDLDMRQADKKNAPGPVNGKATDLSLLTRELDELGRANTTRYGSLSLAAANDSGTSAPVADSAVKYDVQSGVFINGKESPPAAPIDNFTVRAGIAPTTGLPEIDSDTPQPARRTSRRAGIAGQNLWFDSGLASPAGEPTSQRANGLGTTRELERLEERQVSEESVDQGMLEFSKPMDESIDPLTGYSLSQETGEPLSTTASAEIKKLDAIKEAIRLNPDDKAAFIELDQLMEKRFANQSSVRESLSKRWILSADTDWESPVNQEEKEVIVTNLMARLAQVEEELRENIAGVQLEAKLSEPEPPTQPTQPTADPLPEILTADNAFSTFSLNVSDVSFKLAAASLENNTLPLPGSVRSEEFINAMDYHDPAPRPGTPLAFSWDQARHPFEHNHDLLRFSIQTAALGREAGRPLNLVLVLDNSGSMERADRVGIIRQALGVLAGQLTPNDTISVVAFARTARLWVDGMQGGNSEALVKQVGQLNPEGGTNLELALDLAYDTAQKHFHAEGVNRVIVLTDGAANLGNVDPASLRHKVEEHRRKSIALDCFGIGWEGYNDDLLESLSRNGDGRYGFINNPAAAAGEFADQLAGALRVAASNVKAQVEFNPARVISYRQVGYEKHQLTKEQFRDNTVDAAEIGAAESGVALYSIQVNPKGQGPIGVVRVRYQSPATGLYQELEWLLPYRDGVEALDHATPSMRLAAVAASFAEWLAGSPYAGNVTLADLQRLMNGVPETFPTDARAAQLARMIQKARQISGQ